QDLMQFWVPEGSSQLNIANLYADSPITDPSGITVRSRANGTYSTASVTELTFPTIVAKQGMNNFVQDNPPPTTINKDILFKEPSDAINTVTCSWSFQHGPVRLPMTPGTLCLPSNPDCGKPFVLKPPLRRPDQ